MVFKELEALERGRPGNQLVRELRLVFVLLVAAILLVDLLVGILSVVYAPTRQILVSVMSGAASGTEGPQTHPNQTSCRRSVDRECTAARSGAGSKSNG